MHLKLDASNALSPPAALDGISPSTLKELHPRLSAAIEHLKQQRQQGNALFLDLPNDKETIELCRNTAKHSKNFENFVLAGIGGSALGPYALFRGLAHPFHNLLDASQRKAPRFFVLNNIDPDTIDALFRFIDPSRTLFNIISKSGSTAETAAASLVIFDALKKSVGERWKEHIVVTTDPEKGDLRKLVREENLEALPIPPGVGGRFSLLTPVGLFPAFCLGLDVDNLLSGAKAMADVCLKAELHDNPAALFAALLYAFDTQHARPIHVMMAYADRLLPLADWWRQLWAESLGKRLSTDGKEIFVGPTPVKALGATDQHSQVQLYIEGPQDKVFIFLEVQEFESEVALPPAFNHLSSLEYLGGETMNRLMAVECSATREALTNAKRPNMTLKFPKVTAAALGEAFMLLEIATIYAGALYNVNPFDQPGVEHGKILTYKAMGRKGYK
ncbi:glucose-6-phosphate isomerase [bacterium]|nr:glucose-6-phosphate isomerase [bacterium]